LHHPCSEIHIDRGIDYCNLQDDPNHTCKVNGDCHRYIELWNLVFIQFFRDENGKLNPLDKKHVDTGAGFERICQVLQDTDSNYHTDLFMPIIKEIERITKFQYHKDDRGTSHRVIADHVRCLSFALADGGLPSNEGRGYVLRRILRRAARHGHLLGLKNTFLHELVDTVIEGMSDHFMELKEKRTHIKMIIKAEEERFNETLDKGLSKFKEIITNLKEQVIPGEAAFMLYDTFGFPLDLTKIMSEEIGLTVDEEGFQTEMEKQKQRAREAGKFELKLDDTDWTKLKPATDTEYLGYQKISTKCQIQKYHIDAENNVKIVIDRTPFYAESGGQVGDAGKIFNEDCEIIISDVKKDNDLFIHLGKLKSGTINNKEYTAKIDLERRKSIARNHTATHILHRALRDVLGDHVQQKGSLVHPDHLRFDFTHFQQVSRQELDVIERAVNAKIRECLALETEIKSIDEARQDGAMALFGEKYGDNVRVISIGNYSKELCGGTHLRFTGEIGFFKITSESSIAAGIRRIEAITGEKAEKYIKLMEDEIDEIGRQLHAPTGGVMDKIQKMMTENKNLHIQMKAIRVKSAGSALNNMIEKAVDVNGVKLVMISLNFDRPLSKVSLNLSSSALMIILMWVRFSFNSIK